MKRGTTIMLAFVLAVAVAPSPEASEITQTFQCGNEKKCSFKKDIKQHDTMYELTAYCMADNVKSKPTKLNCSSPNVEVTCTTYDHGNIPDYTSTCSCNQKEQHTEYDVNVVVECVD